MQGTTNAFEANWFNWIATIRINNVLLPSHYWKSYLQLVAYKCDLWIQRDLTQRKCIFLNQQSPSLWALSTTCLSWALVVNVFELKEDRPLAIGISTALSH